MTRHPGIGPWILAELKARGIDTVFGIPGVHTTPLYNGLAESGIRHVTPRHEQGAGFMADGFARASGRPAVCFVISGPGLTNILTAMGQAYSDSVPMLVISSVSRREHLRRGLGQLHELTDQQAMTSRVAAFSHTLHRLADLPDVLDQAFAVFQSMRPRPVHIEIPLDLWEEAPPERASHPAPPAAPAVPAHGAIQDAIASLAAAERPLVIAGGGARHAAEPLRMLTEKLGAPMVMTVNARGILPPTHALAVPASPSLDAVRALISESDVILAVGTEFGPTDFDMYEKGMPKFDAALIRVDIDAGQLARGARPALALQGDSMACVEAILTGWTRQEPAGNGAVRAARTAEAARASLPENMQAALRLLETLRDTCPRAFLVGDSTQPIYAGNLFFASEGPGRWFNSAMGFGTLGYGLPAAIGAALGQPEETVICLTGDGGLHFTLGEIAALRQVQANVIILLWNNRSYGEIKSAMIDEEIAPEGVDLFTPDFGTLARAYDIPAIRPTRLSDVPRALRRAAEQGGPILICLDEEILLSG